MTNYNDGSWHGWNGGECPVHPDTVVEIQHQERISTFARMLRWAHVGVGGDIIAFRVTKEHKEPREFWGKCVHSDNNDGSIRWVQSSPDATGAVLFREVME